MYKYKAVVTRVIDGDTYDMDVALGVGLTAAIRVRLNDIDTPETWRPKSEAERVHGAKASDFVEALIDKAEVTIRTYKLGLYGRYSADVTLLDGRDLATVIKDAGLEKKETYND